MLDVSEAKALLGICNLNVGKCSGLYSTCSSWGSAGDDSEKADLSRDPGHSFKVFPALTFWVAVKEPNLSSRITDFGK